eukprot:TRINITY_DN23188_c0_g1_i1.p1 TRINITY_DN23188_c0_g1~~TRINITY_DN23188_c0_g1_i1.p1  ORF type:complete len:658 (+),score=83.34 TRINITY_DN23188_c0_g1_i1:108-2081(+)
MEAGGAYSIVDAVFGAFSSRREQPPPPLPSAQGKGAEPPAEEPRPRLPCRAREKKPRRPPRLPAAPAGGRAQGPPGDEPRVLPLLPVSRPQPLPSLAGVQPRGPLADDPPPSWVDGAADCNGGAVPVEVRPGTPHGATKPSAWSARSSLLEASVSPVARPAPAASATAKTCEEESIPGWVQSLRNLGLPDGLVMPLSARLPADLLSKQQASAGRHGGCGSQTSREPPRRAAPASALSFLGVNVVDRVLFPAPSPKYDEQSFGHELLFIPGLDEERASIPCLFLPYKFSRYIFIYLHANAEDLGVCRDFCATLRDVMQVHVLAVEYPGYGLCAGTASAEGLLASARAALHFANTALKWPRDSIMVLGRSIGTGPALTLAAETPGLAGLILISPFKSIQSLLRHHVGPLAPLFVTERFGSDVLASKIVVPTLIVHGKEDTMVPMTHGAHIFDQLPCRKMIVTVDKVGHNFSLLKDAAWFITPMVQFFSLPDFVFEDVQVPSWARCRGGLCSLSNVPGHFEQDAIGLWSSSSFSSSSSSSDIDLEVLPEPHGVEVVPDIDGLVDLLGRQNDLSASQLDCAAAPLDAPLSSPPMDDELPATRKSRGRPRVTPLRLPVRSNEAPAPMSTSQSPMLLGRGFGELEGDEKQLYSPHSPKLAARC